MRMPLKPREKKEPKTIARTFKFSRRTVDQLKKLAQDTNLSQAEILDQLIGQEFHEHFKKEKVIPKP